MKIVMFGFLVLLAAAALAAYQAKRAADEENSDVRTVRSLPASVQHVVAQMDAGAQTAFFNEFDRRKKKLSVAYLLWVVGWHYFYTRKIGVQIAYWISCFFFIGALWWVIDFFRMPSIVRSVNEQNAREAIQTLHVGAAFAGMPGVVGSSSIAELRPAQPIEHAEGQTLLDGAPRPASAKDE